MTSKPWVYISGEEVWADSDYDDGYFEDACIVIKILTLDQIDTIGDLFRELYMDVDAFFKIEYKKIISTLHKVQSLNSFLELRINSNNDILSTIESYATELQIIFETIAVLTTRYQSIVGQTLNFYDLKNTVDFSSLTKDVSKELTFISNMTSTVSNESKKSSNQMLSIQSEDQSFENLNSALNTSRIRMAGVMRDLKNRLDEIYLQKKIFFSAWCILDKINGGLTTITDLNKMTSTEREVFLNE